MNTTQENENQTFCSPMSSPKSRSAEITYTDTDIDKLGLKFTMDDGAEGHDIYSSIDEILHNLIDLMASNISINHLLDKFWSFEFDILGPIPSPSDKLENGVSLYKTKGNVGTNDISKYGKGIKCASHCIFPDGKMILGLIVNQKLHMAVYNQGTVQSIRPDTPQSSMIEKFYIQEVKDIDYTHNSGFMIISNNITNDYRAIFKDYNDFLCDDIEYDEEEESLIKRVSNHIAICYAPYLNTNFEPIPDMSIRNLSVSICGNKIDSFSHSKFSSEDIDDNGELDFAKEYDVYVPFREIYDKTIYDYSNVYFSDEASQKFTFDDSGKHALPPHLEDLGLDEEDVLCCKIRFTKLSAIAQGDYNEKYQNFEKTKCCSYFVYRNGVCSNTSFIPFEGDLGFRPTDCPQLRSEIHCNNEFDPIINPGSNKSLIRPHELFKNKLRALAKHVQKNVFKKNNKKTCNQRIEGRDYLVTPNDTVLNQEGSRIGEIKGGQVRWDKLKSIKAKEKKELMSKTDNTTPILSETIEKHTDIKEKKNSDFRLFTPNPESPDTGDVRIISNKEYEMIQSEEIETTIFEDTVSLQDKQKSIHLNDLKLLVAKINKNYKIIDYTGNEINLSNVSLGLRD
jgi:hypothetical protein